MVNFTDLKFYDSTSSLGGAIDTGDPIQTATPNNLFLNFSRSELIGNTTKYKCFYMKNESAEDMDNFKIWISKGTPLDYTFIQFGFDNIASPFDGAVEFDGTNDYIDCTNDATLWSKSLTKFSFAVWIYPTAGWDGSSRVIVSHGGTASSSFRCYISPITAGRVIFEVRDSGGTIYTARVDGLQLNSWNHIICSYDNTLVSQNVRAYLTGVIGGTTANLTSAINLSSTLTISDSTTDLKGYIKDFKFWDDQSVNTTEATELYNTNELANSTPSYHLQFGERTGSTTKDAVTKTKVATLTNGASWKLSAQTIADTFTEPDLYNDNWYQSQEIPRPFKLKSGNYVPIWVKVHVDDDEAKGVLDDSGIFTINFDITATGTGSGGTGGTGGGTGGNTGGTGTIDYKIAFAGDWGNTGDTTDVINMMKSQNYDLIIGVGDNSYDDSSASAWCTKFTQFKDKMESAFGNHEYSDGPISTYKNFFGYSKTYNSIRFQNCLILIIDSNDDESSAPSLDEQRVWAKAELDKYVADTNVVWRIAVMHHPPFGEPDTGKHPANEFDQVQKFHKLFTDYDVNFWYCGHDHNFQRTHQVSYNSASPSEPNIVDSSSPYTRTDSGVISIVTGGGGHDSPPGYELFGSASYWAYQNKSNNGVHELVASNTGKTLTGRFRNIDNETFDTFTITA